MRAMAMAGTLALGLLALSPQPARAALAEAPPAAAAADACGSEADISPHSAIRERLEGADAAMFLIGIGAADETSRLAPDLAVVVMAGDEVFGGAAAFQVTGSCVHGGPLFFDPVRYRLGRALVARRRAGLPVRLAALSALAAKGDAEAELLAGSRREMAEPGSGQLLLESAARQGQALAMLELGYVRSGLAEPVVERAEGLSDPASDSAMIAVGPDDPPRRFQQPVAGQDRALAQCWLKAAAAQGDPEISDLAARWSLALAGRMTAAERDEARVLADRSAGAAPLEACR